MSKSLVKALTLLDSFLTKPEMNINELAEIANLPKTTAFRLASSLEEGGLIVKQRKTSHDVTYRMSLKMLTYGNHVKKQLKYNEIAYPHMKKLNEAIDELVHITIMEGNEAVYVDTIDSSKPLRLVVKVGARAPLYAGSAPKLLLSSKSDEELDQYLNEIELKKITPNTLMNKEEVKQEIKKIREKGYSISYSEHFKDTVGLSYPIYDHEGNMVAAIGVSMPVIDFSKEKEVHILSELENTAKKVWQDLGYTESYVRQ